MKPITAGDIVTPKQTTRAFIKGNQYPVTRTHGSVFYINDELGFSKQCYSSDFINLSKEYGVSYVINLFIFFIFRSFSIT